MRQLLFTAPASGGGKTTLTCAFLALARRKGLRPAAFKIGPDYLDPTFHRRALGVPGYNLDLFLCPPHRARALIARAAQESDFLVFEGAMGYYDGVGGTTPEASAWQAARLTGAPAVLVLQPGGSALSLCAVAKGMVDFAPPSGIRALFLNRCAPALYDRLAPALTRATGLPVLGFLPPLPEATLPGRHLGLVSADEVEDLSPKLSALADALEQYGDWEGLCRLASLSPAAPLGPAGGDLAHCSGSADGPAGGDWAHCQSSAAAPGTFSPAAAPSPATPFGPAPFFSFSPASCAALPSPLFSPARPTPSVIAVARDEAFSFYYEESLLALREAGAELRFFSPLAGEVIPPEAGGLYLGGGYPELHAQALSQSPFLPCLRRALGEGLPTLAECGGFLVLQKTLEDPDGRPWPMAGALKGRAFKTPRLVRFGYANLTAGGDSLLFRKGERFPVHEFHHWDCTQNGAAFTAQKPHTGRAWPCGFAGPGLCAAFPHLYLYGMPGAAARFSAAAARFSQRRK